ncbi:MAG: HIT domain-containing protein [Actinobacteria bacterium]|nr:HIT domain-containing protein [Actinomycetota bacterium]
MSESNCLFCKIVSGEMATEFVAETDNTLVFKDIWPVAKVHLLVIPKQHYSDVAELAQNAPVILSEVLKTATEMAREYTAGSFKLQFNTGAEAGQTVFHAHAHVLSDTEKDGS